MPSVYSGQIKDLVLTDGGMASKEAADRKVPGNLAACKKQLERLLKRLADRGTLQSPDQLRNEGDGIYAVRARCGLRAYGWFDSDATGKGQFVVSLFIMKKSAKLKKGDKDSVIAARDEWRSER